MNIVKTSLKEVLSREVGLKVFGNRFYDRKQEYSYPINVVIYNNQSILGYFDSNFYELGFHESLLYAPKEQLQDTIRHELAHYITFINYGITENAHGSEFRSFCKRMGWGKQIQKSTACLDDGALLPNVEDHSLLRKIQKLMALGSSSNKNEAQQAMIKSQQLLLKHNIDWKSFDDEDDEKIILKRIMKQTKRNAKMRAIAKILETFFVNTVFNRQENYTYLEIIGSAMNVEIAEYVANILQDKLETLWGEAKKKQRNLKGVIAKNSFFLGLAQGYCSKVDFLKREYHHSTSHALMIIEKKLKNAKAMVYQRLTTSNSYARHCAESSRLGKLAGKELNINPGINNSTKRNTFYLSFQTEPL